MMDAIQSKTKTSSGNGRLSYCYRGIQRNSITSATDLSAVRANAVDVGDDKLFEALEAAAHEVRAAKRQSGKRKRKSNESEQGEADSIILASEKLALALENSATKMLEGLQSMIERKEVIVKYNEFLSLTGGNVQEAAKRAKEWREGLASVFSEQ
eukprot:TRINITY_DN5967_c0_g1_i1.p1 TRINITY_DN5967_c0_g1~~TRINITY_DN5967_c0_g1_i1.p1  ORF type:complete len:155 (+),score=24.99 TRINITY_DN5967_c0_g1_i1:91-555(+)